MENGRSFRYDYFMDERKDLHMKQAASYISYFEEAKDRIHDAEIENGINELLRKLRDLRDLQYWFVVTYREASAWQWFHARSVVLLKGVLP